MPTGMVVACLLVWQRRKERFWGGSRVISKRKTGTSHTNENVSMKSLSLIFSLLHTHWCKTV